MDLHTKMQVLVVVYTFPWMEETAWNAVVSISIYYICDIRHKILALNNCYLFAKVGLPQAMQYYLSASLVKRRSTLCPAIVYSLYCFRGCGSADTRRLLI